MDHLVNNIAFRLIPKIQNGYEALRMAAKKPSWWKQFLKTWKLYTFTESYGVSFYTDGNLFRAADPSGIKISFYASI